MSRGNLFIVSAPSGAGKTTLAKALVGLVSNTVLSVSHTTRSRRNGEIDGIDYFFIDREQFERMVADRQFLEYAQVFGNYYGTLRSTVEELLSAGTNVILDIDWQGAREVRAQMPDACGIFILPPSRMELEARLRGRGRDPESAIALRMREAAEEMRHHNEYDYVVVNDDFDQALRDLSAIISGRLEERRPVHIDITELLRDTA